MPSRRAFVLPLVLLAGCAEAGDPGAGYDAALDTKKSEASADVADSTAIDTAPETIDTGSDAIDATPDAPTIPLCGGLRCRADQTCVSDVCAFPCTGVKVPGDYSTVGSAVTAIVPTGGTICLGESTFKETVSITGGKAITMIGTSSDRSIVSRITVSGAAATVVLKGIGVSDGMQIDNTNVTMVGMKLTPSLLNRHGLVVRGLSATPFTVMVDGCDIAPTKGYSGISITDSAYGSWTISVVNSWIHDGKVGIDLLHNVPTTKTPPLKIINDTFTGNDTAIQTTRTGIGGTGTVSLTYVNDIIVKNTVGVNINTGTVTFTHRNNAFFGNTTNYSGAASPGTDYVTTDPLLNELSSPPSLKVGSPCRGAADPLIAPDTDFWGLTRTKKFDLGAVQSSL